MIIEQIYTGCLAQGAYYIESKGEAIVIDPLREITAYQERAAKSGAKIKYVLETHFHADFVSGHLDLAKATGAAIVFGPNAKPTFEAHIATDGEVLTVGDLKIIVLHTPGHTMESTTYLLRDPQGKDIAIFTGDTLFIGDVGRPDLAVKSDLTQADLARHLYYSLRNKIMPLADDVIVYPAHGAGSACGKNMSKETFDTLGHQKEVNYALKANMSIEDFITEVTTGLMPPPSYFPLNVMMNKQGYDSIDDVMERGTRALSPAAFEAAANETSALILDTRKPEVFTLGFIPNSISIGIDGGFAPWVGTLIPDIKQQILIVADAGREEEVVTRLARVGYDYAIGYLEGGFEAWKAAGMEVDEIQSVTADEFAAAEVADSNINILDVRKKSEYYSEHIVNAENAPLDNVNDAMASIDKDKTYFVHCAGGYRSMIFASILKARGFDNLINVAGGFSAIKASEKFKITDYVCPTTML
jgi:glyoxylase-like metal-dependent hydrolase (beta-lactamase superfamily II)/rhodanese-related sulfurtransferase